MALGGGTYLVQNKILPGAYINFVSQPRAMGTLGERGTVCMALELGKKWYDDSGSRRISNRSTGYIWV